MLPAVGRLGLTRTLLSSTGHGYIRCVYGEEDGDDKDGERKGDDDRRRLDNEADRNNSGGSGSSLAGCTWGGGGYWQQCVVAPLNDMNGTDDWSGVVLQLAMLCMLLLSLPWLRQVIPPCSAVNPEVICRC